MNASKNASRWMSSLALIGAVAAFTQNSWGIMNGEALPTEWNGTSSVITLSHTNLENQWSVNSTVVRGDQNRDIVKDGCSFVIIGERHLLTAGHCAEGLREGQGVSSRSSDDSKQENHEIEKIIFHARYPKGFKDQRPRGEAEMEKYLSLVETDIALIRFSNKISTYPIRIVPLVRAETSKKTMVVANGPRGEQGKDKGQSSKLDVKFDVYGYRNSKREVVQLNVFILESLKSDAGLCHGDSGGAALIFQNDRWELTGIISSLLSDKKCGSSKDGVLAVPVLDNLKWILPEITGPNA
jgi:hypothetical protein